MKNNFTFRQLILAIGCGILTLNLLVVLIFGQLFTERIYIFRTQSQLIDAFILLEDGGIDDPDVISEIEANNIHVFAVNTSTYELKYSTEDIPTESRESRTKELFENVSQSLAAAWDTNYYVSTRTDRRDVGTASQVVVNEWITLDGLLDDGIAVSLETAYQPITKAAQVSTTFNIIVGLCSLILGVAVMFWLSPKLTFQLKDMTRAAKCISGQDFTAKCDTPMMITEFTELGESINKISVELQRYVEDLKATNQKLQEDIAQREKLEQARKTLFSNISHDLKTPIAIISGYAEGLRSGMASSPEAVTEYSEIISDEADRMQNLIVKLMELNRLESGSIALEPEDFDLSDTVDYLVSTFAMEAEKKKVTVEKNYPAELYVFADYPSAEQTLTNLLQNAISHNIEGGAVRITMTQNAATVLVSVYNTCDPIEAEELPKLWDSFYRRDKSRTRTGGESGLGLAIVRGNMEMMKMPYGVRLEQGGIAFWLELPAAGTLDE